MAIDEHVDLSTCDREPIHHLGAIQPFGFLLAVTYDWMIARASENVIDFMGVAADAIIGLPLRSLLAPDAFDALRRSSEHLRDAETVERVFGLRLIADDGRRFDCALHSSDGRVILEAEPSADAPQIEGSSLIRSIMGRLDGAADLAGFLQEGARHIKALTGFDRVMVYRFDRDGSGEVVAEARNPGVDSFLHLRFPASDIPRQARLLYLRTPFRIIADVDAQPVPIRPQRDEIGAPIDLSLSILRSVSPTHIDYLKHMGVSASLSISIVVEGKLWGLFACHHLSPRRPSFDKRSLAEMVGQMFSMKLETRERRAIADHERESREAADRLLAAIAGNASLLGNPQWVLEAARALVPCDGVAVLIDGTCARAGRTPPDAVLQSLLRRLNAMSAGGVFATDRILDVCPDAEPYAAEAAGLLAIPISRHPRDYLALFRQEKVRTVSWGGDPRKPAEPGPDTARLTPRASFDAWREEVRLRSEPFSDAELHVAESLRVALVEIVLHLADAARQEQSRAAERQELLIAELNHRVRNILALIRGMVRLTGNENVETARYIDALEGRIEALARAHNHLIESSLGPADLRLLIETETAAYARDGKDRVTISGEPALLQPSAFSTLALALHELTTNSAQYGSLWVTAASRSTGVSRRTATSCWAGRNSEAPRSSRRSGRALAASSSSAPFLSIWAARSKHGSS